MPADLVARFREDLARWYRAHRRVLPWRERPEPWRVWVSEIMLQQTQVATVIPYFERFIARFPSPASLAEASESEVLQAWAGLGYYRRARHLHAAAIFVTGALEGQIPSTAAELLRLPGVGRYTAAAIASICHGEVAAVLDGNVARVLSRLVRLELEVNTGPGTRALWSLAEALLDPGDPSRHNQAMMELGAMVCSPRSPDCEGCPVASHCAARAAGDVLGFPLKRKKAKAKVVHGVCGVVRHGGKLLLARRPDDALLGGMWELPGGPIDSNLSNARAGVLQSSVAPEPAPGRRRAASLEGAIGEVRLTAAARAKGSLQTALSQHFIERMGMAATVGAHLGAVSHIFTHRRLTLDVFAVDVTMGVAAAGRESPAPRPISWYTEARWVAPAGLEPASSGAAAGPALPLSRLTRKVLELVRDVE